MGPRPLFRCAHRAQQQYSLNDRLVIPLGIGAHHHSCIHNCSTLCREDTVHQNRTVLQPSTFIFAHYREQSKRYSIASRLLCEHSVNRPPFERSNSEAEPSLLVPRSCRKEVFHLGLRFLGYSVLSFIVMLVGGPYLSFGVSWVNRVVSQPSTLWSRSRILC